MGGAYLLFKHLREIMPEKVPSRDSSSQITLDSYVEDIQSYFPWAVNLWTLYFTCTVTSWSVHRVSGKRLFVEVSLKLGRIPKKRLHFLS